jgi:hypothetical protein
LDETALAGILARSLALLDAGEDVDAITSRFPDGPPNLEAMLQLARSLREEAGGALPTADESLRRIGALLQNHIG